MSRKSVTDEVGSAANGRVVANAAIAARTMQQPKSRPFPAGDVEFSTDNRAPILWLTTGDVRFAGNNRRRTEHGIEKLPNVAHSSESDYIERRVDERTRTRYRELINTQGNLVNVTHTNSSAHVVEIVEGKWSRDLYAQHMLNKAYALGWLATDSCLKRQVAAGTVRPDRLLTIDELQKSKVCAKDSATCKHLDRERAARQAAHAAAMNANEERTKGAEVRQLEGLALAVAKGLEAHLGKK